VLFAVAATYEIRRKAMGFQVVKNPVHVGWYPVDYNNVTAQTVYVGQFVTLGVADSCSGVKPWAIAGAADTTTDHVPIGIVVGTNNRTPLFDATTYKTEYITAVQSQANQLARDFYGAEGMFGKSDPQALVQVAFLGPQTVIKGQIFNAAYGTAPTVQTVTTGSTTGAGYTANASEFTPVAYNATFYCRSVANRGLYRVSYDPSTTTKTFYVYWPHDIAVGDTFVGSNMALGTCTAMFDSTGQFIDNSAAVATTNYIYVDVLELNLETAGSEYALFRLNPLQLLGVRA